MKLVSKCVHVSSSSAGRGSCNREYKLNLQKPESKNDAAVLVMVWWYYAQVLLVLLATSTS